ncbi:pimeloyl-ACP methyl ester carboxylesterase [Rhodothalassium salexigens DSM 2132]|uniref:Palmitoyl-protein thioesterase ABHD10, mitochondrial n=1 Tax=Rhodothalassium salexigens DSM 2132 TaxID=1188247 RepID=A0A4R2PES9_RHOSA|nr:alpha/beta hydrolase [Rhodothalassium salexigens]MBB4212120.1 pimeloyl-ACP methyl ester carboxylesterase [Rhodothalassium salexigens DSM 2132]MBK1638336.1 alpha/beta hydrolase [Rhodothalassium salexigens DSM 2132]TCP32994.1 pimeloyl-ACP methyl ester carboxylesterase [Rhodothalassium salexigens DSM 2132]
MASVETLSLITGERMAYSHRPGARATVVFLGGFMSDMTGTKAEHLDAHAAARGHGFLRFDYRGHGASDGGFEDGTISAWRDDALAAIDQLTDGPLILVGSSMGGWIALLAALARPERVAGLVGVAAAADFTERLMWDGFDESVRRAIIEDGRYEEPSPYGPDPVVITRTLIEDGRDHLVLDGPIPLACPVRLLHGQQDPDVPWQWSLKTAEALAGDDVTVTLIKNGDHRLSTPADLARLSAAVDELLALAA